MITPTGPAPGPNHEPSDVEGRDRSQKQAPGYNETGRAAEDTGGEINQAEPEWRPGESPAIDAPNGGMQGEGEPGRAERDSTGGVEGAGE